MFPAFQSAWKKFCNDASSLCRCQVFSRVTLCFTSKRDVTTMSVDDFGTRGEGGVVLISSTSRRWGCLREDISDIRGGGRKIFWQIVIVVDSWRWYISLLRPILIFPSERKMYFNIHPVNEWSLVKRGMQTLGYLFLPILYDPLKFTREIVKLVR